MRSQGLAGRVRDFTAPNSAEIVKARRCKCEKPPVYFRIANNPSPLKPISRVWVESELTLIRLEPRAQIASACVRLFSGL